MVDPLAAFFRPALEGLPALVLDETYLGVTLLPPLAKVVVIRRFQNSTSQLAEAVLALPPLAPQELVYRIIVYIGGSTYEAVPHAARGARRAHEAATAEGRRAILVELLPHDIPLISIAGIEPGAQVEVQIWSVQPLARPSVDRATLSIPLSAAREAARRARTDADALVFTPLRHAASLSVSASGLNVRISGQPYPDQDLVIVEQTGQSDAIGVECASTIRLDITAREGGSLDHRAWQPDRTGGWEITASRGRETGGPSDRDDWIIGVTATADDQIRTLAPAPGEGLAPNARAIAAFAAAGCIAAAARLNPEEVRLTAHLLSRKISLAFVGPEGEVSDDIPMLRKVHLPQVEPPVLPAVVALDPFVYEPPEEPPSPALTLSDKGERFTPGGAAPAPGPGGGVPAWALVAAAALLALLVLRALFAWLR